MCNPADLFSAAATMFKPVIVSAATQALYGAAIGAAVSAIMGRDVGEGALFGGAAGALTGGISGALGDPSDPLSILDDTQAGAEAPNPLGSFGDEDTLLGGVESTAPSFSRPSDPPDTGIFGKDGFVERNQELIGGVVGGVGKGLLTGLAAREQSRSGLERDRLDDERARENYRGATDASRSLIARRGLVNDRSDRPPGDARFDPRLLTGRYVWDPEQRRIVQQPVA